jgi:hypothetical protein
VGEEHLDALAVAARLLKRGSADERPGDIARILVDAAWDFALAFGQHLGLSGQGPQSEILAR